MKVLLTGAAGQLGVAIRAACPPDVELTALDRAALDVSRADAVDACVAAVAPALIINAAAYTLVDQAEGEPELAHAINATGPANLATSAARAGARLLHVSTDYVFDGNASRPYSPGSETRPLGVYGRTKRAGETAVLAALPDASVVVRTAWVYGAVNRNFLLTMLNLLRSRDRVCVVADQVGTPTASLSLAGALWSLGRNPDARGLLHYTDSGVASWYDFAVAIQERAAALGLLAPSAHIEPIPASEYPTRAPRPAYSVLDSRATHALLGRGAPHWQASLQRVLTELARV